VLKAVLLELLYDDRPCRVAHEGLAERTERDDFVAGHGPFWLDEAAYLRASNVGAMLSAIRDWGGSDLWKSLIVLLALLAGVQFAQAQKIGNDLYQDCSSNNSFVDAGVCIGYVEGVFDTISLTLKLCGWDGVTTRQLRDITVQYLYAHPAERHLRANSLFTRAMVQAFPCHQ
jgi:hypothetical protein